MKETLFRICHTIEIIIDFIFFKFIGGILYCLCLKPVEIVVDFFDDYEQWKLERNNPNYLSEFRTKKHWNPPTHKIPEYAKDEEISK